MTTMKPSKFNQLKGSGRHSQDQEIKTKSIMKRHRKTNPVTKLYHSVIMTGIWGDRNAT